MVYIREYRRNKYTEGVKEGKPEALLKFLNHFVKYKPAEEVFREAEELNPTLFKSFVRDFLSSVAKKKVVYGVEKFERKYQLFGRKLFEYLMGFEDYRSLYKKLKREWKWMFENKKMELGDVYFYSEEEAKASLGEELYTYLKRSGFDFLSGSRYYFEGTLKDVKESILETLKSFKEELKEELNLSKTCLSEKEFAYLKSVVYREIRKIEKLVLS